MWTFVVSVHLDQSETRDNFDGMKIFDSPYSPERD